MGGGLAEGSVKGEAKEAEGGRKGEKKCCLWWLKEDRGEAGRERVSQDRGKQM